MCDWDTWSDRPEGQRRGQSQWCSTFRSKNNGGTQTDRAAGEVRRQINCLIGFLSIEFEGTADAAEREQTEKSSGSIVPTASPNVHVEASGAA